MKKNDRAGLILLIEDNRNLSEVMGEFFEQKGFGVDFASDGLDGYRLACQNSYDVIVLDLNLPRMGVINRYLCTKLVVLNVGIINRLAKSEPVLSYLTYFF